MLNANIFVVPNEAVKVKDCFYPEEMEAYASTLCAMNDVEFDSETDRLIELWFVSENSDNMSDHGFDTTDDLTGEEIHVRVGGLNCYVPSKLINIKEGESTTITFPVMASRKGIRGEWKTSIITMELTANQLGYRYSRYGEFQKVIEDVIFWTEAREEIR